MMTWKMTTTTTIVRKTTMTWKTIMTTTRMMNVYEKSIWIGKTRRPGYAAGGG
jgi:hypothetical protein